MSQSANPEPEAHRPSFFDAILRRRIIGPVSTFVPDSVHPNLISMVTPVFALLSFMFAALAPGATPGYALLFRVLAGILMFCSMLTDHVDGLHARRTNQTSKYGEALDHWFDALHVPLAAAGIAVTLGASGWLLASVIITAGGVYNAQLILYYDTKKFIYPPTGGAWAQVMLSVAYVLVGLIYFFGPSTQPYFITATEVFMWLVVVGNIRNIFFYLPRLARRAWVPSLFIALSFALTGALSIVSLPDTGPFLAILLCVASLRINGRWILSTIVDQRYAGIDYLLMAWVVAIGTASIGGWRVGDLLWAEIGLWACITATAVSAIADFRGHTKALRQG